MSSLMHSEEYKWCNIFDNIFSYLLISLNRVPTGKPGIILVHSIALKHFISSGIIKYLRKPLFNIKVDEDKIGSWQLIARFFFFFNS